MLSYISQPYAEAMSMHPAVSYTPYSTSLMKKTGDIIMFAQFEEDNLITETHDNAESGDRYDDDSIMPPLISKEEMDVMDSGDESEDEIMSTEMSEDICDGSKSHLGINSREARYKICYRIKQRQTECKVVILYTQNMGNVLHKVFKTVVKEILRDLPIVG